MVANQRDGKRSFDSYPTEVEALEAANTLANRLDSRDYVAASMTQPQAIEYANANQVLKPLGLTLTAVVSTVAEGVKLTGNLAAVLKACQFYAENFKTVSPKTVAEAVAELLQSKKNYGAKERYLEDLEFRLGKFQDAFKVNVNNITTTDLQTWLDGMKLSTQSYANNKRVAHLLFEYSIAKGYALHNPAVKLQKVKIRNGKTEVFTPDEAAKMLGAVSEDFRPCLALGLFAGLRSAEIERLEWKDIDLVQRHIVVGADTAKTASRRIVPIEANLAAWLVLTPVNKRKGAVWAFGRDWFNKSEQATAKDAGISWKRNAMRHSFASYLMAKLKDAGRVAGYCGNSSAMIHKHYTELCTVADATSFFGINPPAIVNALPPPPVIPQLPQTTIEVATVATI